MNSINAGKVENDWHGSALASAVSWHVEISVSEIIFSAELSVDLLSSQFEISKVSSGALDTFTEGLWNSDLVELFCGFRGDAGYLELNLSVNSGWWAQLHSGYRERTGPSLADAKVKIERTVANGFWHGKLRFPRSQLPLDLDRLHFSAILGGKFISSNPVAGVEADFHDARCFVGMV